MFFPDLGTKTQAVQGEWVQAIGWLSPAQEFPTGPSPANFIIRLQELCAARYEHGFDFPEAGGTHTCEFCHAYTSRGVLGVPDGNVLFVAPEMVYHYVAIHHYRPPQSFVDAVLKCPEKGSTALRTEVARFNDRIATLFKSLTDK